MRGEERMVLPASLLCCAASFLLTLHLDHRIMTFRGCVSRQQALSIHSFLLEPDRHVRTDWAGFETKKVSQAIHALLNVCRSVWNACVSL